MRLTPGSAAPAFEASTWQDTHLSLEDYRGKKLWLAFFRYASCPLCNLRVRDIIRRYDELHRAGLEVIAVFQSPAKSVAEYVGKQAPPFPLVCDPDEALYRQYGLESSLKGFMHPANVPLFAKATAAGFLPGRMEGTRTRIPGDFFINPQGVIHDVFYGDAIGDHVPFERVDAFVAA